MKSADASFDSDSTDDFERFSWFVHNFYTLQ